MDKTNLKYLLLLSFLITLIVLFFFLVPKVQFDPAYSTVVLAEDGNLLGAKIASDEQWRFPEPDSLPQKFVDALLLFEDKRFNLHRGVDLLSLTRALVQNIKQGRIISGASTLHMQLARIFRKNPPRTVLNKLYEILIALKLDQQFGKQKILKMYATHAPYGGNIIGLETASWRYYDESPHHLSWAQIAALVVIPNSPGIIHPGRNREHLKGKRDQLLKDLLNEGFIDSELFELSLLEDLPERAFPIPKHAVHLVETLSNSSASEKMISTTLDYALQKKINSSASQAGERLIHNGIRNLGILVIENKTGAVLAYVGNRNPVENKEHGSYVDMIRAGRSSGSILKPLLYAACLDEGIITEEQLLPDIPGNIAGYRPRNFNRGFEGAVPANRALSRSLNVPAVYLLQDYSIEKFLLLLKDVGINTAKKDAEHYGLPLILGGADVKLWELVAMYSGLARTLQRYNDSLAYNPEIDFRAPILQVLEVEKEKSGQGQALLSAGAIWQCFEAMKEVERPNDLGKWEKFGGSIEIAWKTGTSYGFKDAWALGISKDFTVGVWVGNASGEGRPGLTGSKAAAPILFDIFQYLPTSNTWFDEPIEDLKKISICKESGYPFSQNCKSSIDSYVPYYSSFRTLCPYHRIINTDPSKEWSFPDACEQKEKTIADKYFILPPLMEYYYARSHPTYNFVPPAHPACSSGQSQIPMALIYPFKQSKLMIPLEYSGDKGRAVFRLAHRHPEKKVFWYIDAVLVARTVDFHEIEVLQAPGAYKMTIIDEDGHELRQFFSVVE